MTDPAYVQRTAHLSTDGMYRYRLTRQWDNGMLLAFIMLNPSTADADVDDPTIRRCMGFARRERFAGIVVGNLYAFRATHPEDMKWANDPFGPGNAGALDRIADEAEGAPIVCAWGSSGGIFGGHRAFIGRLQRRKATLVCLGKGANGMPRHPLYVRAAQPLEAYP